MSETIFRLNFRKTLFSNGFDRRLFCSLTFFEQIENYSENNITDKKEKNLFFRSIFTWILVRGEPFQPTLGDVCHVMFF